jgi:hypothetical protein
MAISLKEQTQPIMEAIHYHPPFINVIKKGKEDSATRKKATQMFYDFYAMELMHRVLGSPRPDPDINNPKYAGNLTPTQAAKLKAAVQQGGDNAVGAMFVPDWGDVEDLPKGVSMVPRQLRNIIDNVYEEVVIALTEKMMAHLRLTLIQEFRYIVTHAHDWQHFRQALISLYNKNGKVTKEEFDKLIAQKIPGFKGHEDSVKRLLKFSKYYASMSPDPADKLPPDVEAPKVGAAPEPEEPEEPEIEPEPEPEPTPAPMPGSEEPDDTDYNAPAIEIPPGADWGDEPYKYSDEVEKAKLIQWLKSQKKKGLSEGIHDPGYAAGRISPHTVLAVRQAINKSGLTWNDILLAYKNLNWGGAYGGPKWGEGVESFIKLMPQARNHNIEDMAGIVDHIYDLEHNTGELLNKGGMFVGSSDLDRRAKITSLARYLPEVSPLIKRLILRVLPYVSKHPELEKNIEATTESPTVPFTPEEEKVLTASRFVKNTTGNEWTTQSPYENKKGQTVQNQYTAKHHTNNFYSVRDSINADIQVFETWPEFQEWLERNTNLFITPQVGMHTYQAPKVATPKDKYLAEHVKTKIADVQKETDLLEICKMAWRPSNNYYKAYLPGDDRLQFFAFTDGTFLLCKKSDKHNIFVYSDWNQAFQACKSMSANALPNQEYDEGKAWIGKKLTDPAPSVPSPVQSPSVGTVPQAEYTLSPIEVNTLQILAQQKGGVTTQANVMPEGFFAFQVPKGGMTFNVCLVGKKAITPTGKKYKVIHAFDGGQDEWDFPNWNVCYNFINYHFGALTQVTDASVKDTVGSTASVTPQIFQTTPSAPLPPNASSPAAYKAHVGIDKPPTHTLRLTAQDEQTMSNAGFEVKMVGSDPWYIHKQTQDTVKFYPNDKAKILFIKTNNKIVVTKTIADALAWIKDKFTAGQGAVSPIQQPTPSAKGSKAGAMYEKILLDAGFEFDQGSGMYVQNQSKDTILIKPFPKSTFTYAHSGATKHFSSLPEMAAYVKNYAAGVKKK